jgi:nucleoporin NDC1
MEYSKHNKKRCCDNNKKRGSPLHAKACAMADVLRNSIYGIMSTFHEKMLTSTKIGLLDKNWVAKIKPLFGT